MTKKNNQKNAEFSIGHKSNTYFDEKMISRTSRGTNYMNFNEIIALIWGAKEILRGNYKQSDYGDIILPFVVLRRLERILESTKNRVLEKVESMKGKDEQFIEAYLNKITEHHFHNKSKYNLELLLADPNNIHRNIKSYLRAFSMNVRDIFDNFRFDDTINDLQKQKLLYPLVQYFAKAPLDLETIDNHTMGTLYEELIRKTSEAANEEAGDHFTPREIIELIVNLLFSHDKEFLKEKYLIRTIYDPAAGTGGMLSVASEYVHSINPDATLNVFGQELNPESYAICKSDMMLKGLDLDSIVKGNSLTDEDGFPNDKFHYMLSNPPFGVDWGKYDFKIKEEASKGFIGKYGPGLPRKSDGSLLFLLHMISKIRSPDRQNSKRSGSRIAIVFNSSPLFTGTAGSGESNIRKWIIENDMLEAIIGLPDQLFYNTGIHTYIWIITNRKEPERKGKVQLINAISFYEKMKTSLGEKRKCISDEQIEGISVLYENFEENEFSKIFDNKEFGYTKIVVERPLKRNFRVIDERIENLKQEPVFKKLSDFPTKPKEPTQIDVIKTLKMIDSNRIFKDYEEFKAVVLHTFSHANFRINSSILKAIENTLAQRDETANASLDSDGKPIPDGELRDYENVPLTEDIRAYFNREVIPYVTDAWIDDSKNEIGYEIPFTKHFYKFKPIRSLEKIDGEIKQLEQEISEELAGLMS